MVRNWCLQSESGMHLRTDDIKVHMKKIITNELTTSLKSIMDFFNSIPKLESRYHRSSTSKIYVKLIYQNKMDLNSAYKRKTKPVVALQFKKEMKRLNIAINLPKKDQCDVCIGHDRKYRRRRICSYSTKS